MELIAQTSHMQIERRFELADVPTGWSGVALLALLGLMIFAVISMYRHEGRAGASARVRGVMASLRVLVLVALALVWLEPVLATYLHRVIDSYTIVLVDTSSSMDLQDRYRQSQDLARVKALAPDASDNPVRRSDLVGAILEQDNHRFLRQLAERNRVRVFTFSDKPELAYTLRAAREERSEIFDSDTDKSTVTFDANAIERAPTRFSAQGAATDIGAAIQRAVDSLGRAPIAGIVLLSDGGINRGDSPTVIAQYADDHDIPLHVVGIGDPSPPRNVRVAEVIAPDHVFADDPFSVVAQISSEGMVGESVTVELIERRADSASDGQVVATRVVTLGGGGAIIPLSFDHAQKNVGRFIYRVNIAVGENESVADDNSKQVTVNVVENKLRVLLISGAPSWEYRYVARLLERDSTFELSCWLQSADVNAVRDGNVVIDHLPSSPEELFTYDAIVMLDPDPLEFSDEWSERVGDLVTQHGGGLLYAAARQNYASFLRDPAVERLRRLLPVTFDPDAELILNQIGHYQQQPHAIIVPPTAAGHPAMRLPTSGDAPYTWAGIGEVYWHLPVLREKPVATVLMRHGDPRMQDAYGAHVLLATQYAGSGRTAFLGFDGTWRWRSHGDTVFNQFWVRMIRYLVEGKLAGGNRRGTILTDQDTYQLGASVQVSARLFDRSFKPLQLPEVSAEYRIAGDSQTLTLERNADRPGWYEASFVPSHTGSCELTLAIPDEESGRDVARREIQVVRPNLEILHPQLAESALKTLAEKSPSGRYYAVDEAQQVPEAIPDRHESTTIRSRPIPLWDNGWALTALIVLLGLEWTLRKVFRLL